MLAELGGLVHVGTDHVRTRNAPPSSQSGPTPGWSIFTANPRASNCGSLTCSAPVSIGAAGTPSRWHAAATSSLVRVAVHAPMRSSRSSARDRPPVDGCERGVARPRGVAHRRHQTAPVGVVTTRDRRPLLLTRAAVQTPRRAHLAAVAERHHGAGGHGLGGDEVAEHPDDRLDLRHLDVHAVVDTPGSRPTSAASDDTAPRHPVTRSG